MTGHDTGRESMEEIVRIVTDALEARGLTVEPVGSDKGYPVVLLGAINPDGDRFFIEIEPA
jgi:hypothetical protein